MRPTHRPRRASPSPSPSPRRAAALALAALAPLALAAAPSLARGDEAAPPSPPPEARTVLGSYGELNYNRPRRASEARADLRRFVLGLQHRFDERTQLVAEVEIEHAVSSANDAGEVEIEQAFVERQLTDAWSARAGLFLVPLGLLNENHEPTAYYGVERNFVETAIIPTTWREGGLQATAVVGRGVTVQAGLTTSFDLGKWDATSEEGRASPLGAVHQELSEARARDWGGHLAVSWRGVPGLLVGAAAFAGNGAQGRPAALIALWDGHARWTPGRLDLSALYARGTISHTGRLNGPRVGSPVLLPAEFDGWYVQAAVRAASWKDLTLSPFARYEQFNTGRRYADLGPGLTPRPLPTQAVLTLGANLAVGEGVVVKADVQSFVRDHQADRLDLGLGWSF